jgi:hypothetical protein
MKLTELEYAALSTKSSADSIAKVARAALGSDFSFIEQAVHSAASDQRLWGKAIAAISAPTISEITAKYAAASGVASLAFAAKAAGAVSAASVAGIAGAHATVSGFATLTAAAKAAGGVRMPEPLLVEQALHVVNNSRNIFLENPSCLSAMAESITRLEFEGKFATDSLYENPEILAEASKVLSTATDSHSFIEKFKDSPPLFQTIIYFVILQIFIPQIVSINANLLTPYVKSYLNEKNITKRERINKIKKLPLSLNNINTDQIRFVTGNNVRLRKSPSTNAEILDEMVLGQVITVLSKKKNWINVEYTYEDGKVITGWIFTIYTKRFKK